MTTVPGIPATRPGYQALLFQHGKKSTTAAAPQGA